MQGTEDRAKMGTMERTQVEAVVERLVTAGARGESVAEVAHDARNMVTALGLYCDLLEEPGVLASPFAHYGSELRLVAAASRRLVDKLTSLDRRDNRSDSRMEMRLNSREDRNAVERRRPLAARAGKINTGSTLMGYATSEAGSSVVTASSGSLVERGRRNGGRYEMTGRWDLMPSAPIENMAAELLANHNLLAALAGPTIALTVDVDGGGRPVRMTGEDLTRVLVNLVKNSAEAMPAGGRIKIGLCELPAAAGAVETLSLSIEDSGPGVSEEALEEIFASGYSTRTKGSEDRGSWPVIHRGLGLSITRSMVEGAGGRIVASNCVPSGARFEIELPVRNSSR